jgi:small subunit ribosomal protein S24e
MQILKKEENALLGRTEVEAELAFEGATPSRQKVLTTVAAAVKVKPELIVLVSIKGNYGQQSATVTAHAYKNREQLEKVEGKHLVKRLEKKEKPKEEAPAEKAEEKPAEEPKAEEKPAEEAKAEEKPAEPKQEKAEKPADDAEKKE